MTHISYSLLQPNSKLITLNLFWKVNKLTTDMSRYIWHILSLDPYIPMSWGIDLDSIESDETSLEFHVQGFVHTGNVRITFIEGADVFQVTLYGEDGELKETINDVYNDNLVSVIDEKVEKQADATTDDYTAKVMNFLICS